MTVPLVGVTFCWSVCASVGNCGAEPERVPAASHVIDLPHIIARLLTDFPALRPQQQQARSYPIHRHFLQQTQSGTVLRAVPSRQQKSCLSALRNQVCHIVTLLICY